jgi:hypothetical protein
MDWKALFFSADGRIGRSAFWIGWLVLLGVNVVLGWIRFDRVPAQPGVDLLQCLRHIQAPARHRASSGFLQVMADRCSVHRPGRRRDHHGRRTGDRRRPRPTPTKTADHGGGVRRSSAAMLLAFSWRRSAS